MSNTGYDFCPKCGAIQRNGVCTSCGYKVKDAGEKINESTENLYPNMVQLDEVETASKPVEAYPVDYIQNPFLHREKKSHAPLIIVVIIVVLALFAGLVVWIVNGGSSEKTPENYSSYDTSSDNPDKPLVNTGYSYSGDFKEYIEENFYMFDDGNPKYLDPVEYVDENDYYVYSDYIRDDLHYYLKNAEWGYYNPAGTWDNEKDSFPHNLCLFGSYPVLYDTGLSNEKELNDKLRIITEDVVDLYNADKKYIGKDQEYYSECYYYVTYMDESNISILFLCDGYLYEDKGTDNTEDNYDFYASKIVTINITDLDKEKGRILDMPEGFSIDGAFVDRFVEGVNETYEIDFEEDVSKEKLLKDFLHGSFAWVYTPIGIEYVYNFDDFAGSYSYTERY